MAVQVELYYNPKDTVLAGMEAVWVRGGFNRWRHAHSFGPLLMTPPGEGGQHFLVCDDTPPPFPPFVPPSNDTPFQSLFVIPRFQ